jgi:hypothetical protein
MADDIVLNAATRTAQQNLQSLQGSALLGLKQAAQNDEAVADLIEQATDDPGTTTPTRGKVVNIKA